MALLNYAKSYEDVRIHLGKDYSELEAADNGDYVKLFFVGDKEDNFGDLHIYTHGVDFLADFQTTGGKGLVPSPSLVDIKNDPLATQVLTADGWKSKLTTASLPMMSDEWLPDTLVDASFLKAYLDTSIRANDAMTFKGTLDAQYSLSEGDPDYSGNIRKTLPLNASTGDAYIVEYPSNTYISTKSTPSMPIDCTIGDMIICIKGIDEGAELTLPTREYWSVVEGNITNVVEYTFNNETFLIVSPGGEGITWFAPTISGETGQILLAESGSEPQWVSPLDIVAGSVQGTLTINETLSGNTVGEEGQLVPATTFNGTTDITIGLPVMPELTSGTVGPETDVEEGGSGETGSSSTNGIEIKIPKITVDEYGRVTKAENMTLVTSSTENTWRPIYIGDSSIGTHKLRIRPTDDFMPIADEPGDDYYDLGWSLTWCNITNNGAVQEYAI